MNTRRSAIAFLEGGGEAGAEIRAYDWSKTPLGHPETWPRSLKTAVSAMLAYRQAALVAWGPELTVVFNDAFISILGGPGGRIGKQAAELWAESWKELRPLVELTLSGEAQNIESRVASKGMEACAARHFLYGIAPLRDDDDSIAGVVWTATEITGQIAVEAKLLESEERLRLAVEAAEIGLWDVDPVAETLFWPPRVKAMFGISADVLVSMADFYAGLHPEDRPWVSEAYAAATDPHRRALYDVEYRTVGKEDGKIRWVAAKGRGIFDSNATCVRVIGTAIDISARKEIERQLRELNETLEARVLERTGELAMANRQLLAQIHERERTESTLRQMQRLEAVGQLTSGVAHDFNNLLTVVLGQLQLASRDVKDEKMLRRFHHMKEAAERGAKLTAQLLAFSRRQHLNPKPIDINEAMQGMSELLRSTLGGTASLQIMIEPRLWPALVDQTQLELAVLNLAINARDAMPVGGEITIETRNVTLGAPNHPEGPPAGDYIEISVADTGTGMAPEVAQKAFEPFFTTKEPGRGSGLGLAQVYGFSKQSGGGVRVETELGRGTSIKVYLPRALSGKLPSEKPHAKAPRLPVSGLARILLVDDDNRVREVTKTFLEEAGYSVCEAGSGGAAIDQLQKEPQAFAAAVIDFAMPGMNGSDLAEYASKISPGLPILFATGYADSEVLASTGLPVLTKPFEAHDLIIAVAAAIGKPKIA
jgi:PAS domain S-box-containing protein